MADSRCSVRPMRIEEIPLMVSYFISASPEFLHGMGADIDKLPTEPDWIELLEEDFVRPVEEKTFFYVTWLQNQVPCGHSNINKLTFGKEASMHLHLWPQIQRQQGLGTTFVQMTLPIFFEAFQLQTLYCEPYALNPAPNKTLPKLGFEFIEQVEMVPGWINFHQPVNRYQMTRKRFESLYSV